MLDRIIIEHLNAFIVVWIPAFLVIYSSKTIKKLTESLSLLIH
jgi:hypothetical protein